MVLPSYLENTMTSKPLVTIYTLASSEDGIVRYIGQTTGRLDKRLIHHHYDAKKLSAIHKSNWIRSVIRSGHTIVISAIEEQAEWGAAERRWIEEFRERGFDLVNTTDGGEGVVGYVRNAEWRARRSALMTGRASPLKGTKMSDEQRAKISAAQVGRVITPEQRAKISAALKGRKKTPEHIEKVAAANRKPKVEPTAEEIEEKRLQKFSNLSARSKGKVLNSGHKAKISAGLADAYKNGRRPAMAKLTDDQVREIRLLLAGVTMSQREIADAYGISPGAMSELKNGKSYQHVK